MVYLPREIIMNIISFLGGAKYINVSDKKMMKRILSQGNLKLRKMMVKDVLKTITSKIHLEIIKKAMGKTGMMRVMHSFCELYLYLPTHKVDSKGVSSYFFNLIYTPIPRTNTYLFKIVIAKNHDHKFYFNKKVVKNDEIFSKVEMSNLPFEYSQELCIFTPGPNTFLMNGKTFSLTDDGFLNELYCKMYYYVYASFVIFLQSKI